ncbi:MAG: hypothetical protein LBV58_02900 [Acholeplasmatales bacterium]|jgi:hypothetical protein|nr:hypothetical protein [Acholeplasmatales bacterium]
MSDTIILNKFCSSFEEVISSNEFLKVITSWFNYLHRKKLFLKVTSSFSPLTLQEYYYLLIVSNEHPSIDISLFTEGLYDYYRKINRFALLTKETSKEMIEINSNFNNLILSLYRTIHLKLTNEDYLVYRELPAGTNATFKYEEIANKFNLSTFSRNTITRLLFRPPFIIDSKSNIRTKQFYITDNFQFVDSKNMFNYFIYVGKKVACVVINKEKIGYLVALANLFETADVKQIKKVDIVIVYGDVESDCGIFYNELEKRIYGYLKDSDENDYFGYLKKILLTCQNILNIKESILPIHGASAVITLNGKKKNIILIGDSGAGKSETLEALKKIDRDLEILVIYDDMGSLLNIDNSVYTSGTETGAFVRLDDLEKSFAPLAMDRAIFINPKKTNSRVVVPVGNYNTVTSNYQVDILLYANNYSKSNNILTKFHDINLAKEIFKSGKRYAKGTTSENGLVETFFANPFGPVQLYSETNILIDYYLELLYKNKSTYIGEINTKLGIVGFEEEGPRDAAKALYKLLKEDNYEF